MEAATVATSSLKKLKRKRNLAKGDPELERLNSLPWNSSLPQNDDDDAFSLFIGTNELEGGFLSLEEIDEAEYGLNIPEPEDGKRKTKKKSIQNEDVKKQQQDGGDGASSDEVEAELDESVKAKEKKKKKKKKTKKKEATDGSKVEQPDAGLDANVEDGKGEEDNDEAEFYAWSELRLHPLLMKAICKLGFKEPTPIQKACIPAAAHQGKDVVGAAETGSGKTLAFGLPILQRILEEREKDANMVEEPGKYSPKGVLRALIIAPTRELALQVTDHLKAVAKYINVRVTPIVGGILAEKQERLLKAKPEIVVGTPGRLWELMSTGEKHLVELHSLSFFVLDEADRMVQSGHFKELQSIIDMLPMSNICTEDNSKNVQKGCVTVSSYQRKKRQTLVFSATVALSADFRKKLKRGSGQKKQSSTDGLNSIETLSERAGMRSNAAIIDLTNPSILAAKLEESFIECREEDKDAYLYYILTVHGQGRTIVFCTSIAALRHISSILRILGIDVWTLHAQMQQRARLKAIDRFRENENGILVATDVAARGLDIPGVRTVVHYQLPHSAEVYVHRSGRTARASAEGCSIALISPKDTSKFASLCKSFSKDNFQRFPLENSYMPEVLKRLSLARQIDKITRKDSQVKAEKNWFDRNASSVELITENYDSEEEQVNKHKEIKASSRQLKKLQEELKMLISRPLQSKSFSHRYLAGSGVTPLMQEQLQQLARQKLSDHQGSSLGKKGKLVVIGQDCMDALQALRSGGEEVRMDIKELAGKQRNIENLKRKRKEEKKRLRDQRRKQKKKLKYGDE
ncbi:DEAD-box ATP-dependent RNA helicase 13 [Vigna angularis]|uniref:DEAD-box ATP-dependent RNA helicase 13 n=1 Tax=Phaseolus angularis TaxID=3914 RepID=UPI00080A141F|nr:DEAD-box ATP-dependent RNA helicase 13 [Vigna angularis]XP_017442306.1 DEAD-box ATP-dependent RNA helicase 13 [Vigna angularis]XP_017442307.1 DEAD-box ATP-dependent RNA helicase 13 [Vigna angularis]XP_017442308.1 DEAD-box ATP-dependent RNA helicase 13 [Vigna angularis]